MAKWISTGALLIAALLCCAPPVAGASAGLDRSFGARGFGGGELGPHYAQTSFGAVVEQPGGLLLAAREEVMRRYLPNGALDPGFAPQRVESPPPEATQPDGKRLVRGADGGTVLRFNADGSPDHGFHGGVSERVASYWVRFIVPLPSGKILVAGEADRPSGRSGLEYRTGLSRLNADGTLDRSFGNGSVYVPYERTHAVLGLVPQPDEAVLVVGRKATVGLTAAGEPDEGFGVGGTTGPPGTEAVGFKPLPGGGFSLAGTIGGTTTSDFFLARYGPEGGLDPAFAEGRGMAIADLGAADVAASARWEGDGSVLIGGATTARNPACEEVEGCLGAPALVRFSADGTLDRGFGGGGAVRLDPLAGTAGRGGIGAVGTVAARGAGGYFLAGSAAPERTTAFLAAVAADGTLDPSFGSGGIVRETRTERSYQYGGPVAVGRDGKILVGGATTAGYGEPAAVFRYTPNGKVDTAYGAEPGFARLGGIGGILDIAVARSGAAVVLGWGGELIRVTPAGAIDPRFGSGRPVALDRPRDAFRSVAVQENGKVLVAGTSNWHGRRSRMIVARLLPDGGLDPSFGRGGFAVVGCRRRGRCGANHLAVQPDGRILLAGRIQKTGATAQYHSKPSRLAVARLHADGRPDRGFDGNGVAALRVGYHAVARAIAWSRDGILVAGRVGSRRGERQTLLLRYRPNGRLDGRFGRKGIVRGPGEEPVAVLPTPGRIFVLDEEGPVAVRGFAPNGRPELSLPSRRLTRGSKWSAQFDAALQGGKPVLAWTMIKGPNPSSRSQIELARLSGG